MKLGELIYNIERAAALQEYRGGRPDTIIVSRELYEKLLTSLMIICHETWEGDVVRPEERLCGMVLKWNLNMKDTEFFLGTKYDLDEMSGRRREEHGQED